MPNYRAYIVELLSVDSIPIPEQKARSFVPRKASNSWRAAPFGCQMFGNRKTNRRQSWDRITKTNSIRKRTVGTRKKSAEPKSSVGFERKVRHACEGVSDDGSIATEFWSG
jgi:hypothetical protein